MKTNYETRLKIPINGPQKIELYNSSKKLVGDGYQRIVIGERGPYVEFNVDEINKPLFYIPESEKYRVTCPSCYYIEYRSLDDSFTKLYYQKLKVTYADYRIGKCYISPFDLYLKNGIQIITPLRKTKI